ncbi:MAG: DUF5312 domain-containing protein [Treponema sp.]|nr:DUF5312 domain-containing protein [Treponema sp.]
MGANDTLDRLVSQMSVDERMRMLGEIRRKSPASADIPPERWVSQRKKTEAKGALADLHWASRLFYRIAGLFSGRTAERAYEGMRVTALAKVIKADSPGYFDFKQNCLRNKFYADLLRLRDAARFFYGVLETSINKDRGAFYAVVGSIEMPEAHRALQNACHAHATEESQESLDLAALKQAALRDMDDILQAIPESKRAAMYLCARALACFRELSCFLFNRFVGCFRESKGGRYCPIDSTAREFLASLDRVLFALRDIPVSTIFEALLVYDLETRAGEPGFDAGAEMESLLRRSAGSLETVKSFSRKVPLSRIIRCSTRNMSYVPAQLSGGEDWLQVYRNYWKRQIESSMTDFFEKKKRVEAMASVQAALGRQPEPLANAAADSSAAADAFGGEGAEGFPLKEAFALAFLRDFVSGFQERYGVPLEQIAIEGNFIRQDDRAILVEAGGEMARACERIAALDEKMSAEGEYGSRQAHLRRDAESLPAKKKKAQFVVDEASKEARGIIARSGNCMAKAGRLLESIATHRPEDGRDAISNLDALAAKRPALSLKGLGEMAERLRQAARVLDEIGSIGQSE